MLCQYMYITEYMPFRCYMYERQTVLLFLVGSPIDTKKEKNPNRRYIDRIHKKYVRSLAKLFQENKIKYGIKESTQLVIV